MISIQRRMDIEATAADLRATMIDLSAPPKRGRPRLDPLERDRARFTGDLYAFAREPLQRDRLIERIHRPWCAEVARTDEPFQLWLCPRGSYKTTLFTEALPLWLLVNNPNLRILIVSATASLSKQFVRAIRGHLRQGRRFSELWGNWLADSRNLRRDQLWTLTGDRVSKEPNLACGGLDEELTSSHYDVIIADDLVSRRDRESLAQREATKRFFQDLISILEPGGRIIAVGTRWHHQDAYADLQKSGYITRRFPIRDEAGQNTMPEIFTDAALATKLEQMGSREFAAQMELKPMPLEGTLFSIDKLHFYRPGIVTPEGWFVYADPSLGRTAKSDYSAILAGFRHGPDLYIDYADIRRLPSSQFVSGYVGAVTACGAPIVKLGCESNSFQEFVLRELRQALDASGNLGGYLRGVEHTGKKEQRIESLEGPISAGRIHFRSDWATRYPRLIDNLVNWPQVEHDDPLDALEGLWALSRKATVGPHQSFTAIGGSQLRQPGIVRVR